MKSSTKYLGIIIDENLNWNSNIIEVCKKLSRSVGIFAKLRHYLDYKTMLSLYYSMFHSHVIYHLPVGQLSHSNLDKLSSLQKRALRLIHFKKQTDPVLPLFLQSKILPIEKQVKFQNCLFAHDQLKDKVPTFFKNFLQRLGNNHNQGIRGQRLAHSTSHTITYGSNNLKNSITRNWNKTVDRLNINPLVATKGTYKKHLKAFYLDSLT